MRLRTLPLAIACILMGSFLAWFFESFNPWVLLFSLLTTLSLQILSNLANDYGDSKHGVDHGERKGPSRAVQSGKISGQSMKKGILVFVILSIILGNLLLLFSAIALLSKLIFLLLGMLSILAAIKYTMGKKPYGYRGLGDISVFIFFGIIAVVGTYFLHTNHFLWDILLPAASTGLFAVAVLNINNIRDIESDSVAGKMSIPVRLGRENGVRYHWFLLVTAVLLALLTVVIDWQGVGQLLFLLAVPLLWRNATAVARMTDPVQLNPMLKQLSLSTLAFVVLFGLGQIIG